jgi:NAD-dependent deacetylase
VYLNEDVKQRLKKAKSLVVFTGAGMSSQSGIATFRNTNNDGLWGKFNPAQVATPEAFKANPQKVWDWYVSRADGIRNASPHAGHHAIAKLAKLRCTTVITQNVDCLHQRSGVENVLELHGNILKLKGFQDDDAFGYGAVNIVCPMCGVMAPSDMLDDAFACSDDFAKMQLVVGTVPTCPCCNARLRPSVVWFGEPLDPVVLDAAASSVEACDALLCLGASLEVEPAASLPFVAVTRGAVVVEVNITRTSLSELADAYIEGGAAEVLPDLVKEVWGGN